MDNNPNGNRPDNNKGPGRQDPNKNHQSILAFLVCLLVTLVCFAMFTNMLKDNSSEITYDKFIEMVDDGDVKEVTLQSNTLTITPKHQSSGFSEEVYYANQMESVDKLTERLEGTGIKFEYKKPDAAGEIISMLVSVLLPTILLFVLLTVFMRRMNKGGGMMGVGKSRAKAYIQKDTGITFRDVAGQDEAKESLQEVVDFLHNPGKYTTIGAKLPKGALLVGPPGTGKTSRALKFMVEEALNDGTGMPTAESIASGGKTAQQPASSILLMSYTNRAVDEICEMLVDSGIPFLRLGSEYSCDERFRPYLIEKAISDCPKLEAIKQYIIGTRVIVGTTSMMTSKPFIFLLKHFKLAIIDESSQILEPNLIGLLSAVDKFILIGDYKQLPAVVQQSEQDSGIPTINDSQKGGIIDMSILQDICLTNCRNSLFERLIHWEDHEERSEFIGILRRQGRMHPEIAEFPNRMFYRREKLEPVPCPHQLETELSYTLPSEDALDDLLKEHRMIFFPSKFCKEPNVSDKINANEAAIVVDLLRRIHRFYGERFDAKKTVGVIVPYRNQIAMVRKGIEKLGIPELEKISIDTVERYQGSQRDVIIYSFTIQNIWQLDFLAGNSFVEDGAIIDRKLNVAITRARKQMIMTGNPEILRNNQIFSELMNYVKEKGGYF